MIDLIKKAVLTGIGVAALTRDKVEEFSKELIDKGKLSEQEGEKFLQDMQKRAEESRDALKNQTDKFVESALNRMQLAKSSDLEKLQVEIEALRKEIEALRNKEGETKAD
jgi:polyhydroxyalkanoate synthesis regulator phasin